MKTPDIKQNPHPKMRYEITLTIQDAPGPFESVEGYVYYEVTNKECSPENPISGTWGQRPTASIPLVFTPIADGVYTGTVYLDLLQDEDYFGLGVCHWKFGTAGASLKAKEVGFTPGISSASIATGRSETTYFSREHYVDTTAKGMSFGGVPLSAWITKQPDRFFSATLIAKEQLE
ncbi:hypothetical protein QTI24_07620 [Variovorax sp. J22P240]|uniref:hypothetical protein n=1 Tax=Variovorax sp. J22P240 TaxID=3053514 RepID=UPI0025772895|nr:hypothetical protein [Variovorax sp. J22P240]MDL9998462.1 hypothetical protein [Variovorax sp. J22P240]